MSSTQTLQTQSTTNVSIPSEMTKEEVKEACQTAVAEDTHLSEFASAILERL